MTKKRLGVCFLLSIIIFIVGLVVLSQISFQNTRYSYLDVTRLKVHKIYRQLFVNESNDYFFEKSEIVDTMNIPQYELILSQNDINHFSFLYTSYLEDYDGVNFSEKGMASYLQHNKWRKAELVYQNDTFNIKIRSHGSQPDNGIIGDYISFRVKLKDGRQINNSKTFKLLIYESMKFKPNIIDYLSEKFSLIRSKQNELVKVKLPYKKAKLYYFEHLTNDKIMEVQNMSSYHIFESENFDSKSSVVSVNVGEPFINHAMDSTFLKGKFDTLIQKNIIKRYKDLNQSIISQKSDAASGFFNVDYISSFLAARYIGNFNGHEQMPLNSIIYYNFADGKFYPTINREPSLHGVISDGEKIEKHFFNRRHPVNKGEQKLILVSYLTMNDDIRIGAYEKTYDFIVSSTNEYIDLWNKGVEFDKTLFPQNIFYNILAKPIIEEQLIIDDNLKILEYYLSESNPSFDYKISKNQLSIFIKPNSFGPLKLDSLFIDLLVEKLKIKEATAGFTAIEKSQLVKLNKIKSDLVKLSFFNGVTQDGISDEREYKISFQIDDNVDYKSIVSKVKLIHDFTKKEYVPKRIETNLTTQLKLKEDVDNKLMLPFVKQNDSLILKKGDYFLRNNLILPPNHSLIIEAGTNLILDSSVSFITQGSLFVNGTQKNPVSIKSEGEKFGTFAVLGSKGSSCLINFLTLYGGSESVVNGVYYSGQLSVHYSSLVNIQNSHFSNASADDCVNIKYCKNVSVSNSFFTNNYADHIDLDYCKGILRNNSFINQSISNLNGDGIDASGSSLIVENNKFQKLGDKGISVGENSSLTVLNNTFSNLSKGVAVKDFSKVYLFTNTFYQNEVDVALYQKKVIFGGSTLITLKNIYDKLIITKDSVSSVILKDEMPSHKKLQAKSDL